MRALIPAFGGLVTAERAEHMPSGQHERFDAILDILLCGAIIIRVRGLRLGWLRRIAGLRSLTSRILAIRTGFDGLVVLPVHRLHRVRFNLMRLCLRFAGRLCRTESIFEPRIVRLSADGIGD